MKKQLFAALVAGLAAVAGFAVVILYAGGALSAGRAILYALPAAIAAGLALRNI